MPFSYPDNVPDAIKNLPEGAQRVFVEVFNAAHAAGKTEAESSEAAWGAVKQTYEQSPEGDWVQKATERVLRYVSAISLAEGSNLGKAQVFRTGTFYHPLYGRFIITDADLAQMAENFVTVRPKAPTELVVDYEHQSNVPANRAPAAGWVKGLEHTPGELTSMVDWTDEAAEDIRSRKYRFISPVWQMNYKDKETGKDVGPTLIAVALTNRPFLEGMAPVVLSESIERANAALMALSETTLASYRMTEDTLVPEPGVSDAAPNEAAKAGVEDGGEKNEQGDEHVMEEELRKLLGLGPDDDILEAVRGALAKTTDAEAAKDTAEAATVTEKTAKEKAESDLLAKEVADDVDVALRAGKLLPKQVESAKIMRASDPAGFETFIANAGKTGPELKERGRTEEPDEETLTATEASIADKLGNDHADVIAQKKADAAKVKA